MLELKLYKQEGHFGPFQIMFPAVPVGAAMLEYLPCSYGDAWGFCRDGYGLIYLEESNMDKVAQAFFKLAQGNFPPGWQEKWQELERAQVAKAREIANTDLIKLTTAELLKLYQEMGKIHLAMWAISIFIDALDPGFDQAEIKKIVAKYGFQEEEVHLLLTPTQQSYITNWEEWLARYQEKKITFKELHDEFFWYATDYAKFGELDEAFIQSQLSHAKTADFENPLTRQQEILAKYGLKSNPLITFQILAAWRDERKWLNYVGIYGLMRIIKEAAKRQNINSKLISGILPSEAEAFILGSSSITNESLAERLQEGFFVEWREDSTFGYVPGAKGREEMEKLEQALSSGSIDSVAKEFSGMIASTGRATGRVKIVLQMATGVTLEPGEILVTSMTRPEYVPLMKQAAAIVTDEGGISCHAAIVSRELGKPCTIGTRIATKVLKDGDLVEVDANNGIVKVL